MMLKEVLDKTAGFFREKGFPSARLDAELLLAGALGVDRIRLYLDFDQPVGEPELNRCREFVRRRGQGEPVAYILGKKDFFGFSFEVSSSVLIPRPETEHLVEAALEWTKKNQITSPRILDLGCGSGCIGLSLLKNLPEARLLAIDLSEEALMIARKNAESLGVSDRSQFFLGNAGDPSRAEAICEEAGLQKFDMIVANPPYIDREDVRVESGVKMYEPSQALFSEDNGLQDLKSWTRTWAPFLASPGFCAMEMGTDQGPALQNFYLETKIFNDVKIVKDLAGHDRVIEGVCHG